MFDATDDAALVTHATALLRRGATDELEALVPPLTEVANGEGAHASEAAYLLGGIYLVALDSPELAVEAFEQAGEHPGALRMLAGLVAEGRGVAQDELRATQLYRDAAERGDMVAQYELGMRAREHDAAVARRWLEASAAQGYADAISALREETDA